MKTTDIKNRNVGKPRSLSKVLVISGLYAILMGGAAYFTYKLLIEPARERDLPSIPKRTEAPADVVSLTLSSPAPGALARSRQRPQLAG